MTLNRMIIILIFVHLLPMLGVVIDNPIYKYPYILLTYIAGLIYYCHKYDQYLEYELKKNK